MFWICKLYLAWIHYTNSTFFKQKVLRETLSVTDVFLKFSEIWKRNIRTLSDLRQIRLILDSNMYDDRIFEQLYKKVGGFICKKCSIQISYRISMPLFLSSLHILNLPGLSPVVFFDSTTEKEPLNAVKIYVRIRCKTSNARMRFWIRLYLHLDPNAVKKYMYE